MIGIAQFKVIFFGGILGSPMAVAAWAWGAEGKQVSQQQSQLTITATQPCVVEIAPASGDSQLMVLNVPAKTVPEPSALALVAASSLLLLRRERRAKNQSA